MYCKAVKNTIKLYLACFTKEFKRFYCFEIEQLKPHCRWTCASWTLIAPLSLLTYGTLKLQYLITNSREDVWKWKTSHFECRSFTLWHFLVHFTPLSINLSNLICDRFYSRAHSFHFRSLNLSVLSSGRILSNQGAVKRSIKAWNTQWLNLKRHFRAVACNTWIGKNTISEASLFVMGCLLSNCIPLKPCLLVWLKKYPELKKMLIVHKPRNNICTLKWSHLNCEKPWCLHNDFKKET